MYKSFRERLQTERERERVSERRESERERVREIKSMIENIDVALKTPKSVISCF